MKITTNEEGLIVLEEVDTPIMIKCKDNEYSICERDGRIEIKGIGEGTTIQCQGHYHNVSPWMTSGSVK